jgi:hypothetical protein
VFKKGGLITACKKAVSQGRGYVLIELCRWCAWYQKLVVKKFFGVSIKKPYKNCPRCGCPTTVITDDIVCACGVCRRLLIEKFVVTLNNKKVSSVEYDYECYICGNTSNITFLHLCGDGELGECDALSRSEFGKPLGFTCIRCKNYKTVGEKAPDFSRGDESPKNLIRKYGI